MTSDEEIMDIFNHVVNVIADVKIDRLAGLDEGNIGLQGGTLAGIPVHVIIYAEGPTHEDGRPVAEDGHSQYEVQVLGFIMTPEVAEHLQVEQSPGGHMASPYKKPSPHLN